MSQNCAKVESLDPQIQFNLHVLAVCHPNFQEIVTFLVPNRKANMFWFSWIFGQNTGI